MGYGIVKAASQGLGIKSLLKDFKRECSLEVLTDASAAKSIANRTGLGKLRHIDTHFLWVQQRVSRGDFKVSKVWGKENPADLLTKFLDNQTMLKHMQHFVIYYLTGRAAEAPSLSSLNYTSQCLYAICGADAYTPACAPAVVKMFSAIRKASALPTHLHALMAGNNVYQPRGGAGFLCGDKAVCT